MRSLASVLLRHGTPRRGARPGRPGGQTAKAPNHGSRAPDIAVLGGFQVSEKGDLANWKIPGYKGSGGIGGAMDIAAGSKKLIVCMEHNTKEDVPKIVKTCNYPLTGLECVDIIVTDLAVIDVTPEGLVLRETAPGWTPEEVQARTEAKLIVRGQVPGMNLSAHSPQPAVKS